MPYFDHWYDTKSTKEETWKRYNLFKEGDFILDTAFDEHRYCIVMCVRGFMDADDIVMDLLDTVTGLKYVRNVECSGLEVLCR